MPDQNVVWPHVPADDFQELSRRFRPLFAEIREGAIARDRDRDLPRDAVARLKAMKLGALRVPADLGGFGTSLTTLFALLTELAEADSNLTQILRGHFGFVETLLLDRESTWSRTWLERAGAGELFSPAHTEPGDSHHGRFSTAVTDGPGAITLTGEKYYSTGAYYADWIGVTASRGKEVVWAVVSTKAEGVSIVDDWDGFGQSLTASGTTIFDRVALRETDIQSAFDRAPHLTAVYQLTHLATLSGIGRAAATEAASYIANRRRTYAHSLTDAARQDPQILQVIGNVFAKVYGANAATIAAAGAAQRFFDSVAASRASDEDRGRLDIEVYQAQVVTATQVLDATTALFGALGASALSRTRGLDRFWRNARAISSHNPLIYRDRQIGDFAVNAKAPANSWISMRRDEAQQAPELRSGEVPA